MSALVAVMGTAATVYIFFVAIPAIIVMGVVLYYEGKELKEGERTEDK